MTGFPNSAVHELDHVGANWIRKQVFLVGLLEISSGVGMHIANPKWYLDDNFKKNKGINISLYIYIYIYTYICIFIFILHTSKIFKLELQNAFFEI